MPAATPAVNRTSTANVIQIFPDLPVFSPPLEANSLRLETSACAAILAITSDFSAGCCSPWAATKSDTACSFQTEEFRISSNKSLIKDSARQLFEVLIFKRLQCARADLRRPGDLLQRYTAEFALTPEFVPESSHYDRPLALICV